MMGCSVSIIVPIYNCASFIEECLKSLKTSYVEARRIFPDLKVDVICVDDGSTDDTKSVITRLSNRIDGSGFSIQYIYQERAGVSVARNLGLHIAKCEWIAFVDGDDKVLPLWLSVVMGLAVEYDADWVRIGLQFWHSGTREPIDVKPAGCKVFSSEVSRLRWGWHEIFGVGCGACVGFFRARLFNSSEYCFPPGMRMKEDRIFNMTVLERSKVVVDCEYAGYLYRRHNQSTCHKKRSASDSLRFFDELDAVYYRQLTCLERYGLCEYVKLEFARAVNDEFFEWIENTSWKERLFCVELRNRLLEYLSKKLFMSGSIKSRWKLGRMIFRTTGSFWGFNLIELVLIVYRTIKLRNLKRMGV